MFEPVSLDFLRLVQVDAAAEFTGTLSQVGNLVSAAGIPCGSVVRISGQSSGPVAFSCLPVPVSQQIQVGPWQGSIIPHVSRTSTAVASLG